MSWLDSLSSELGGLSDKEVADSRNRYGSNEQDTEKAHSWVRELLQILKEPMLILLIAISVIYLIVGHYGDALFMFFAIVLVSGISFYQDNRSRVALAELAKLNEPFSRVIRNGIPVKVNSSEIVQGDLCIVEEGQMINADGRIISSNDFSVNESALTGESFPVFKDSQSADSRVYSGTLVNSGLAIFKVEQIGLNTKLGRIGRSMKEIRKAQSPLQIQISTFVQYMTIVGLVFFLQVWVFTYYQTGELFSSLLNGLTIAMSVIPEEIPVAFTTFMAIGAWKLSKEGVVVKQSSIVETLGSTTVICVDKTGTITQGDIQLKALYRYYRDQILNDDGINGSDCDEMLAYAMWSSEPIPFDPMEIALHKAYERHSNCDQRPFFQMRHEYPLEGKPPMMTHVFESSSGERIIAAKGAPEAIVSVSGLPDSEKKKILEKVHEFGNQGYRILGLAKGLNRENNLPARQSDIAFQFLGLLVFYDPPKAGIGNVFRQIEKAGISLKVITGDGPETTQAIALQAGIRNDARLISGQEIAGLDQSRIGTLVKESVLFVRMFPEAKLTVVNALKRSNEVVAMIGDGINDGPALKAAHIGVAMGRKGTETAKAAAGMIIVNDDLEKLLNAIAAGRRIYSNLKKAVQYIISIHIPIILIVSIPLLLGWVFPQLFTPVHVIFLELIMGPTCSIVYENEPMESNTMIQKPRKLSDTFLRLNELLISLLQGLVITAGLLFVYQWSVINGGDEVKTRTMVFSTLVASNLFLSYTNRSVYFSVWETLHSPNRLLWGITGLTLVFLFAMIYFRPFSQFFLIAPLCPDELGLAFLIAACSVMWIELYKWGVRKKNA